ncbi:HNH endonuclease [Pseudomonas sp. CFBP 8758]|uniref:HNH endonuclease signature motif containing protein n=1 Tax=Pseudomonas sp. CFBP 8758 TaxID=2775286 RepID=UPI00177DF6E7|nr:HNH endonuclease signature motif containing protein [Pseudomonas sp. CFBP 8758]MBD8593737.1 HNH endonuclease [Pseudomonas sp. CFBP 8758]
MHVEIHHIDHDPSNNIEENLVVVCKGCHSKAHSTNSMAQNLTQARLKAIKIRWLLEVKHNASKAMLPSSNMEQAMWTYINHQRLPDVMRAMGVKFNSFRLIPLVKKGMLTEGGLPIFQLPPKKYKFSTIYDRFEWDVSMQIHDLYRDAVDHLIVKSNPIELGAIWGRRSIKNLVGPGDICFCLRGFNFSRGEISRGEEDRLVVGRSKGIEIRFMANTRHMWGSSAILSNFVGSSFSAVLLLVKNVFVDGKYLVVEGTPLAMGAGFLGRSYKTPHKLKYGWSGGSVFSGSRYDGDIEESEDVDFDELF